MRKFAEGLPFPWPFAYPQRFNAIAGDRCKPPAWFVAAGAWGCYRSHLRILENCLNESVKSVLIFEDDCVFIDQFVEKFERFANDLPDQWSMIYLGGQHLEPPRMITPNVYEAKNINRTHCYGIRGDMIQTVYSHLCRNDWRPNDHIDGHLGRLQTDQNKAIYCPDRWLVGQRKGDSDIGPRGEFPERFWRSADGTQRIPRSIQSK